MELKSRAEMNPEFMWDLTHMFKDNGEFEKAFSEAETLVGKIASLKGTLGESLQSLKNGLDTVYSVYEKVEPVYIYTMLKMCIRDSTYTVSSLIILSSFSFEAPVAEFKVLFFSFSVLFPDVYKRQE